MEADGSREPDPDQAETKLGDIVAGEADDEENENQEALVVECPLKVGLDVMRLGSRNIGTALQG